MRALALEHLRPDPVGIFGEVLEERGIEVDAVRLEQGEPLPDWRDYALLVAMGGAMSVWEEAEHPWLVDEKRAIREAVLAGVPYFGVCLGAQLLAAAFGARVYVGPEPELGASPMFLTAAARRDPVFRGLPPDVEVLEFHLCHFDLPAGAVRLARSPRYQNQAIRYGHVAYAIQCHLEPSLEDIRAWFDDSPQLVARFESRHGAGSVEAFFDEYAQFVPFLQRTGRQLFGRWLEHARALGGLRAAARAVSARGFVDGIVGRERERLRVDALLDAARAGDSAALVLRGEAGSGKTTLLDDAVARATGLRVLRTAGRETEAEARFAGLAELCRPLAGLLETLPPARALPLAAALGLAGSTGTRDRFAAYGAALDLFTAAAEEAPLLLVVDDAQWLDEASAEAIAFVAQRLGSDGIAVLAASEAEDDLPEMEELQLHGLDAAAARALVEGRFGAALAPQVAARVVEAAHGNPLALLEIPVGLTPAQRAGEEPVDEALLASAEWAFLARIGRLPLDARRALLVAALSDEPDVAGVARACAALGVDASLLAAAEEEGLARREGRRLVFRHPLVRSSVAYSALRAERRAAHAAIAGTVEGEPRLWHLARAAAAPDAALAAGLEAAAESARDQAAYGAAARTLELAARLTPQPDEAARRLLLAGGAAHLAGHVRAALDHLEEAARLAADPGLRSRIEHLRGRVAAAPACAPHDPVQAAELLADAVLPSLRAGDPAQACGLARRAADLAEGAGGRAELAATLMLGTALVFAGDYREGAALVERAADMAAETDTGDRQLRSYVGAGLAIAGRHRRAREELEAVIDEARGDGALGVLPYALVRLATVELETGRWPHASAALHDALRLAQETGQSADNGLALGMLAWLEAAQGRADACRSHVEEALELADRLGSGSRLSRAAAALGLLELGAGRPAAAIPHLEEVRALQDAQGWSDAAASPHVTADLIEAYAGAGRTAAAAAALEAFEREATRTGRASALAAAARCRALFADDADIDSVCVAALAASDGAADPFERARTELLYGARLVAAGRAGDARAPLGSAFAGFARLGATPWQERVGEQLVLAGAPAPRLRRSALDRLTPLELDVTLAVAAGGSIREVAHRLFLGRRTAQRHLASALAKLELESTSDLAGLFAEEGTAAVAE